MVLRLKSAHHALNLNLRLLSRRQHLCIPAYILDYTTNGVSCSCNHTISPTFMSPYPWLLQLLQKQLLEVILLVLMADQSQSLTWVMAMLSTLLSSAALPWWQKERVPACQRKGSAESRRVTVFLTFLSVWQTAASFIDMATHTWAQWQADNERSYTFSCFCWAFSVSPYLLFSVNLRIVPFFSSATSHTSVDQIQIPGGAIQGCSRSCISSKLPSHTSRDWSSLTLL